MTVDNDVGLFFPGGGGGGGVGAFVSKGVMFFIPSMLWFPCSISLDSLENLLLLSLPLFESLMRLCILLVGCALYLALWVMSFLSLLSCKDSIWLWHSIICIGVDFIPPVMIIRFWFWTEITFCRLLLAAVPQVVIPYSRTGLTYPV